MTSSCQVHKHWSEWSDPACESQSDDYQALTRRLEFHQSRVIGILFCVLLVGVEQSHKQLNILVILSISLGIPMILLAAMLLLRRQR